MIMNIQFAVVVPYYNRSEQLHRLLQSVQSQTFPASEIFIVDNGSSVEDIKIAMDVIQSYPQLPIILISTLKRGNANFARNLGTLLSTCTHVAYLDSDDWWEKDHLISALRVLTENAENTLVYSDYNVHKNHQAISVNNRAINYAAGENAYDFLFSKNRGFAQSSGLVLPRTYALASPWSPLLKRNQDYDFFIRALDICQAKYTGRATVNIDWHFDVDKAIDYSSIKAFYSNTISSNASKSAQVFFLLLTIKESYIRRNGHEAREFFITELISIAPLYGYIFKLTPSFFMSFAFLLFDKVKTRILKTHD